MPQWPIDALRRRLTQGLASMRAGRRLVVIGCDHGANVTALAAADVLLLSLPCVGMLPPSFVEYALHTGAGGVVVSACREGACEFRLGQRWTQQRLRGEREPHLRPSVAAPAWTTVWADAGDEAAVQSSLERMRGLTATPAEPAPAEVAA